MCALTKHHRAACGFIWLWWVEVRRTILAPRLALDIGRCLTPLNARKTGFAQTATQPKGKGACLAGLSALALENTHRAAGSFQQEKRS